METKSSSQSINRLHPYKQFSTTQLNAIVEFTRTELRNRFDNTASDFLAVTIIEEARLLGFTALGESMIIDLANSQDNMSEFFIRDLVAKHEGKNEPDYDAFSELAKSKIA